MPGNMPTSFEGEYGHIRYEACVVIIHKNQERDEEFKLPFTVIESLDLNWDPTLRVIFYYLIH